MTNEIAEIQESKFLALRGDNAGLVQAMEGLREAGVSFGPGDMTYVKVPAGGGTTWQIEHPDGEEENCKAIEGVIVYVQKRGTLWPSDEMGQNTKPVLVTDDLVTARQVGPIPDDMIDDLEPYRIGEDDDGTAIYDWEKLPYNQYGSARNGRGKRCKEQRLLYVLRPGDLFPIVVRVPAGSLKSYNKFLAGVVMRRQLPYWRIVANLSLTKKPNQDGIDFSEIAFKFVEALSEEDGAKVKSGYTDAVETVVAREVSDTLDD